MNVGYDNILTSTLHVVKLREIIAVVAADTQQLQLLSRLGGPRGNLDAFYVYNKKTTTRDRIRNNFVYTDDSL